MLFVALLIQAATPSPPMFAMCRANAAGQFPADAGFRVELMGTLTPEGKLDTGADVGTYDEPRWEKVNAYAAVEWYALSASGHAGTARFSKPRVVPMWNEEAEGVSPAIGGDSARVILGPCEAAGTIYATVPMTMPTISAFSPSSAKRRIKEVLARPLPETQSNADGRGLLDGRWSSLSAHRIGRLTALRASMTRTIAADVLPDGSQPFDWKYSVLIIEREGVVEATFLDVKAWRWIAIDGRTLGLGVVDLTVPRGLQNGGLNWVVVSDDGKTTKVSIEELEGKGC